MSIPASSGKKPSSMPHSKDKNEVDESKNKNTFKMPNKKERDVDEEADKQSLFDIASNSKGTTIQQQQSQMMDAIEQESSQKVNALESAAQIEQVAHLIERTVETMHIGELNGQSYASLQLQANREVPAAFAGANMTLSYEENQGLSVQFKFLDPQQENLAIQMVERNKEQLSQLVQALEAKNIQVNEFLLGTHVVAIPWVATTSPVYREGVRHTAEAETEQQEREGDEGGPPPLQPKRKIR